MLLGAVVSETVDERGGDGVPRTGCLEGGAWELVAEPVNQPINALFLLLIFDLLHFREDLQQL